MNTPSNGIRPWLSVLALSAASLFMAQNALAEIVGTRGGDKGDQVKPPPTSGESRPLPPLISPSGEPRPLPPRPPAK